VESVAKRFRGFVDHLGSLLRLARTDLRVESEVAARLAAIVESSDDAIVGKSLEGIVTSWNRGAERLFGYTADEMVGQSILRIIPSDRQGEFSKILGTIRRGDRVDHFETERVHKDGHRIFVSLTVSPIRDASGSVVGASKIARDVTDRRKLDAEREEMLGVVQLARAEAELASRFKDEFLVTLSHELRSPLSAVQSAIMSARLDEGGREHALEIAYRQGEQLTRLVDDLLDLARIKQGRIRLNRESVSVVELLERAVETTRSLVERRRHTLSVSLPPAALRVHGDALRLAQAVVNLVTNAAKYTQPGGRIELRASAEGHEAVIRVRDNGSGIPPDLLQGIFEPYVQAPHRRERGEAGLGIGLTVVQNFMALHGGRVEAFSEGIGKGAEFVVHLPAAAETVARAPDKDVVARGPLGEAADILVVEDNPDAAEGLALLLKAFGQRVRVAKDGPTALEAAGADAPTLMLVDIGLPGMDGYEVARRARQLPGLRSIVMVALTGFGYEEDRKRALAAGFDAHFTKPVDPAILRSLVARVAAASGDGRRPAH
jgi:two-component system, chemotaxis family, CheB/CheR fusion protein